MGSANYKNNIMRDTTVTISELELDGETAFKIANCIKKHEPEIWKGLSKALKQALPIPDVVGKIEQLNDEPEYCNKHKWNDCECTGVCRRGLSIT